jgi:hypothetical protein
MSIMPDDKIVIRDLQQAEIIAPPPMSPANYSAAILRNVFEDFGLVRDMAIATLAALGTLALQVREHLIPIADWQHHKLWWVLSFVIPYVAIIGGHIFLRFVAAPWRLHNQQNAEHQKIKQQLNKQIIEISNALQIERDHTGQPDVALIWDWPEDQKKAKDLLGDTEKSILVHNRSDQYVYNIQIEPIQLGQGLTFDLINEIEVGGEHLALGRWDDKSSLHTNYIYFFSKNEQGASDKGWVCQKIHNRGFSNHFLKVPMAITYESNGVKWRWEFEFIYDNDDESLFTRKSGCRI